MMNNSTTMSRTASMQSYIYTFTNTYGVLESILSSLSASDVSSFMCAFDVELPDTITNKYVNVMRDMPEHLNWITEQSELGNKVMLIGTDLERLGRRIISPSTYDRKNEKPLCIWLVVAPSPTIRRKMTQGHLMTWKGDLLDTRKIEVLSNHGNNYPIGPKGTESDCLWTDGGASMVENTPITAFICRFEHMKLLPNSLPGGGWFISTIPNENNIKVVYFASYELGYRGLTAALEPCKGMNPEAIACREMLTGEKFGDSEDEWNIPLIRKNDAMGGISTLRYNLKQAGIEIVTEATQIPMYGGAGLSDLVLNGITLYSDSFESEARERMNDFWQQDSTIARNKRTLMMPIENLQMSELAHR